MQTLTFRTANFSLRTSHSSHYLYISLVRELQFFQAFFDVVEEEPDFRNWDARQKKLKAIERELDREIPAAIKEFYALSNMVRLFGYMVKWVKSLKEQPVRNYHHNLVSDLIDPGKIPDFDFYKEEWRKGNLMYVFREGDADCFIHLLKSEPDPQIIMADEEFFGNGFGHSLEISEHVFSRYAFLKAFDSIVYGNFKGHNFSKGIRAEIRTDGIAEEELAQFYNQFLSHEPTLHLMQSRKFHRFHYKSAKIILWQHPKENHGHLLLYARQVPDFQETLEILAQFPFVKRKLKYLRRGDRNTWSNTHGLWSKLERDLREWEA